MTEDEYTKLLLHMDDVGLTNSSLVPHSVTKHGQVTRSSAQSVFGGYSAYFDGAADYLSFPDHTDFYLGSSWTIDFRMWLDTTENVVICEHMAEDTSNYWSIQWYLGGLHIYQGGGTGAGSINTVTTGWSQNTWYHIAVVGNGGTITFYRNGINIGSGTMTVPTGAGQPFGIGARASVFGPGNAAFKGYLDEFRLSNGVARWTNNFTPPEEAYGSYFKYISGTLNDSARIIVINESDWSVEYNEVFSTGLYDIGTTSGTKLLIARRNTDGEIIAYGNVT